MTDSESDVGIVHVRNRLLELVYTSNTVFSVDQIARILGVDESRIVHELKRGHSEIVYDPAKRTVVVREHSQGGHRGASQAVNPGESLSVLPFNYGSDAYDSLRVRGAQAKGALRKTKYRRSWAKDLEIASHGESGAPKGRVGYVCVADEFRLSDLEAYYSAQGYYTKFDCDVLHIRFSDKEMNSKDTRAIPASVAHGGRGLDSNSLSSKSIPGEKSAPNNNATGGEKAGEQTGSRMSGFGAKHPRKAGFDLFVFEYGAIVWWGFDQRFFRIVENDFMLPNSAISRHMVNRYMTQLVSENYPVWCTYTLVNKEALEPDEHFKEQLRFDHFLIPFGRGDPDTSNVVMLCASHALAQSAKIDYLELKVQELTESCSPLPRELREKGHATITERRLLQLRSEVLSYRLMLKSGSDLMDEPDFFWENAYLKPVFQATKECFEIVERVAALDNKLDAANEILSMLAEEFSQRHGARLEWIVIWLVFVEVVIGVLELLVDVKPWIYLNGKN